MELPAWTEETQLVCPHGNDPNHCTIICGVPFCKHVCMQHQLDVSNVGKKVNEIEKWSLLRACCLKDCDCGYFAEPSTTYEAVNCGRAIGERLVRLFLNDRNRDVRFDWRQMEKFVREFVRYEWLCAAKHGLDSIVEEEAVKIWRTGELAWEDDEDYLEFWMD